MSPTVRPIVLSSSWPVWAHGFVSMELAGAFRLGGDVDAAFDFGIDRLTDALTRDSSERAVAPDRT